jgi:hypothetical protein
MRDIDSMAELTLYLQRLIEAKRRRRAQLASLPFPEKVRIII